MVQRAATEVVRRVAPVGALVVAALALATGSALAHVTLVSSSPMANAKLGRPPASVSLTFGGPIRSGTLSVTGPDGRKASTGSGGRDPRNIDRLLVQLKAGLKPGRYTVYGSTIAADTHHQTWTFSFTVKR